MAKPKDETRMVRGAYSAGFDAGFRRGIEMRRKDGWRTVSAWSDLQEGQRVQLIEPTIFGRYRGTLYVDVLHPRTEYAILRRTDTHERIDVLPTDVLKNVITHDLDGLDWSDDKRPSETDHS